MYVLQKCDEKTKFCFQHRNKRFVNILDPLNSTHWSFFSYFEVVRQSPHIFIYLWNWSSFVWSLLLIVIEWHGGGKACDWFYSNFREYSVRTLSVLSRSQSSKICWVFINLHVSLLKRRSDADGMQTQELQNIHLGIFRNIFKDSKKNLYISDLFSLSQTLTLTHGLSWIYSISSSAELMFSVLWNMEDFGSFTNMYVWKKIWSPKKIQTQEL